MHTLSPEFEVFGDIQCLNVPTNRAIRSFVAKHISRWITGHKESVFEGAALKKAFHTVSLRRQGAGHQFVCHVKLKFPSGSWSGSSFGEGLHQTILRALQNLTPVSPPHLPPPVRARIPRLMPSAA